MKINSNVLLIIYVGVAAFGDPSGEATVLFNERKKSQGKNWKNRWLNKNVLLKLTCKYVATYIHNVIRKGKANEEKWKENDININTFISINYRSNLPLYKTK